MRKNEIDIILEKALERYNDISDIILTVGRPIQVVNSGKLIPVDINDIPIINLTSFQTEIFALNILQDTVTIIQDLLKNGSCDCSYQLMGKARFRVNIFSQRGVYSIVLRKLSSQIPSIEKLQLSSQFHEIAQEKHGLVLVTGATGSGKSSTLAAIINEINEKNPFHIITLEDPIEFDHPHKQSTINQRELGLDFNSFPSGLRSAMRQTPQVILVGEMRDKETFEIVLTAAETGHLVFSTVHTTDTGQTISRILTMFDKDEEPLVRCRLAESIRWIIGQRLIPKITGGRVAAVEIMKNNSRINQLILHGETENRTFYDILAEGSGYGMQTFDQALAKLYRKNLITDEIAKNYCSRKSVITQEIDYIKAKRGSVPDIQHLIMEEKEKPKPKTIIIDPNQTMEKKMSILGGITMSRDASFLNEPQKKQEKQEKHNGFDLQLEDLKMEKDENE